MNGSGVLDRGMPLTTEGFRQDVIEGLSRPQKTLPCKYLYDEEGARLFEAICELVEYYPTRTELGILRQNIKEITSLLGPRVNLVDLGSGSGLKTRLLLKHLERAAGCVPVDVARTQLLDSCVRLAAEFPKLEIQPVCADYTRDFAVPSPRVPARTVVFFPGSTIGNFEPEEAAMFLERLARICSPAGGLLIGVDLKKDPQVLHRAYNDAQGVTAQFNLNLLARANRELQAGFDLKQFHHQALFNETTGRIEMHLVSRREQSVPVDGCEFAFARGESIVTEHSYKYHLTEFRELAAQAGLEVIRYWTDPRRWFSLQYLKPRADRTHHAREAFQ